MAIYKKNENEGEQMTYETYDPKRDPSGAIGHALADRNFWRILPKLMESGPSRSFLNRYESSLLNFLKEAEKRSMGPNLKEPMLSTRRNMLEGYFPELYGPNGRNPARKMTDMGVNSVFNKLYREAISLKNRLR